MSGYDDVRDVGQAVTLQEKKDNHDDHDDDASILMDLTLTLDAKRMMMIGVMLNNLYRVRSALELS